MLRFFSTEEVNSTYIAGISCSAFDLQVLVFTKNWLALIFFFSIVLVIFYLNVCYNNLVYFILVAKNFTDSFISIKY